MMNFVPTCELYSEKYFKILRNNPLPAALFSVQSARQSCGTGQLTPGLSYNQGFEPHASG